MTRPAARARGLAGGLCHDTQFCIVTEARGWPLGGCVTIQSLYRDRRAVWLARVSRYNRLYRDRRKAWPLGVSRYNAETRLGLCCDTAEEPATWGAAARTCVQRHDRGLLQHDREGAMTRSRVHHDTAQRAPRHGAVHAPWAQWAHSLGSGCAPGAPNPVLDSVHCFSHCLDHCS